MDIPLKRVDYGILFIEQLKKSGVEFIDTRHIAEEHHISAAFLEKIAQELKHAGWIEARKGRGGGYRVTETGFKAGVGDIINFFERPYEVCPVLRVKKHETKIA